MFEQKLYDMIIIPVINGIRDEFHYEHHLDGPNKDESIKQWRRWLRRGASSLTMNNFKPRFTTCYDRHSNNFELIEIFLHVTHRSIHYGIPGAE